MTMGLKERYDALTPKRESYLRRARTAAKLTVPSIMPPEGHNYASELPQPNQGFGATCVLTLAARIAASLLPPGRSAIRLRPDNRLLMEAGVAKIPEDAEIQLGLTEDIIEAEVEGLNWRPVTNVAAQHLIIAGNVGEQTLPDGSLKVFRLDQYVVVRDASGNVIEAVIEEKFDYSAVPEEVQTLVSGDPEGAPQEVTIYTGIKREGDDFLIRQEVNDALVPRSEGSVPIDRPTHRFLRYAAVAGEDYGRGKVEEHIADFILFDTLSKSLREGAGMASRHIIRVDPGARAGVNLARRVSKAENGEFVVAGEGDLTLLQFANQSGLVTVQQEVAALRRDLGVAFLLSSATARDAERVTATEVRMAAEELEGILGGVYSMLSEDMMLMRFKRLIYDMTADGKLPDLKGLADPIILVGLQALGRESEAQRIMTALQVVQQLPPEFAAHIDKAALIKRLFLSLDIEAAVKTEEEVAKERQKQMAEQAIGDGASAGLQAAAAQAAAPTQ